MKRLALVFSMLFPPLLLCSCKVNWFDRQYDAPWWAIAISSALILAAAWFFAGKAIAKREYKCSE